MYFVVLQRETLERDARGWKAGSGPVGIHFLTSVAVHTHAAGGQAKVTVEAEGNEGQPEDIAP